MAKILTSSIAYKGPCSENLIELIRTGLDKNADHTILINSKTDRSWKGSELKYAINFLAKMLIQDGLRKGDICTVYGDQSDEIVILLLAIIIAGGVPNFLKIKESGYQVHDTAAALKSKFLFSSQELIDKIKPNLSDLLEAMKIVPFEMEKDFNKFEERLSKVSDEKILQENEKLLDKVKESIQPDSDLAVIQFSSGTTGKPKPIPRTHKNLCHLVASVDHEELMDLKPGVVLTGSLAISHRPGLWALLASIYCGNTFVIWDNLTDVEDALKTIEKYKVTLFSSSLPFLSMLGNVGIRIKDRYNLSTLKHIITSGGKILRPELPKAIIEAFNLISLRQCFGMTESGWVFLIEQSLAKDNYLSVGHVVPGMEAIIINRDDVTQKLEKFMKGELALRGPQIFPGYLTEKPGVLNRSDFIEGNWFRIGDQAYYDDSDLVYVEGRYKELLFFENNSRYFPDEVEKIIAEHSAIEGVCVVKIGEVRKDFEFDVARAYVTLRVGSNTNEKELLEFIKERSRQVMLTGGIRIIDTFPRLQNGKVDKHTLSSLN